MDKVITPIYIKDYINPKMSEFIYEGLMNLDWVSRENTPRKEYWDTLLNQPYTYGNGVGMRTYEPNERSPFVDLGRESILDTHDILYEGCFLNRYDTAKDALGWHSDDDMGIDHNFPIMVITLGQAREIQWKIKGSKGIENINTQNLESGSLFIMPAGMQESHFHRIPKAGYEISRPRISMTFRKLIK